MALLLPRREKLDLALTFDFNLVVWLFGSYFAEDSFDAHAHASASGAQISPGLKVVVLWEVKEAGRSLFLQSQSPRKSSYKDNYP